MNRFLRTALVCTSLTLTIANVAEATKYTSVASGNFSATSTWMGGITPPLTLLASDTIIIASGHDVVLDNDLSVPNNTNLLDVKGIFRTTVPHYVTFNSAASLFISGIVDVDSMAIVNTTNSNITGQMTIRKIRWMNFLPSGNGTITILEHLHLLGPLNTAAGCTVNIGNNAIINMRGGSMPASSNIVFPATYDVTYTVGAFSQLTGKELDAPGLRHITLDINDTTELKLGADVNISNGNLTLLSGTLSLNNHHLIISNNADIVAAGIGHIKSTSASNVSITNNTGISGALKFRTAGNTVGILSINPANGATIKMGSDLKVTNNIDFQNGKIDVQNYDLSLIAGATLTGNDANKYIITSGVGALVADVGSGLSYTYPIGTATHYLPCIVTSKNNTVYNRLRARVNPEVKTLGTTGSNMALKQPMVNATWFVEHTNTSVDLDIELMWDVALEVAPFNRSIAYISHFAGANWDKIPGTPAQAGTGSMYSIKRAGIKSLSPFAVFDNNTVGVKDIAIASNVRIYPNPATTVLNIDVETPIQATIFNTSGQQVSSNKIDSNNQSINISALPKGIYYMQLKSDVTNTMSKFIKL